MKAVELDNEAKNKLMFAISPESVTPYQRHVLAVIRFGVTCSDNSDELLERLRQGQAAFAEAIEVVRVELKLVKKGTIVFDDRKAK